MSFQLEVTVGASGSFVMEQRRWESHVADGFCAPFCLARVLRWPPWASGVPWEGA